MNEIGIWETPIPTLGLSLLAQALGLEPHARPPSVFYVLGTAAWKNAEAPEVSF